MVGGRDGPASRRVWNLNHLWGRLRDFYQVRGWEAEAEPGRPPWEGPSPVSYVLSPLPPGGAAAADPVATPRPPDVGV